jgi:hypothetical protein
VAGEEGVDLVKLDIGVLGLIDRRARCSGSAS